MSKKAIRKLKRSGTEGCDMCGSIAHLVEHHLHGRKASNETAWICPTCHDDIHVSSGHRKAVILGWYRTTAGLKLVWHLEGEPVPDFGQAASPPVY